MQMIKKYIVFKIMRIYFAYILVNNFKYETTKLNHSQFFFVGMNARNEISDVKDIRMTKIPRKTSKMSSQHNKNKLKLVFIIHYYEENIWMD